MMDMFYISLVLFFFGICIGYVRMCEWLARE